MLKKTSINSPIMDSDYDTSARRIVNSPKNSKPSRLWLWISCLLIIGLVILGSVSSITSNWLRNLQISVGTTSTQPAITTFNVKRTVTYANLYFTVLNAQYAVSFPDDTIQAGSAVVRLNM